MADNRVLRQIARGNGGKLLNAAIESLLPVDAGPLPAKKNTLLGGIAGAVAVRVATRSVPGAILIGGAVLAKRLYERRHTRRTPIAPEKPKRGT